MNSFRSIQFAYFMHLFLAPHAIINMCKMIKKIAISKREMI